ncbi:tetraspanin-18 [Aplysia californica]|uniref:Tetraspanin n=1 Tax=Aplysia californica TaxID=6500 RepID=A0ABM0ZWB0_APLCA|nr:tetraspanin-18 [Aplysia californica]
MATCCKVAVIVVNVLMLLVGLVFLIVGAWTYLDREDVLYLSKVNDDATYSDVELPGFLEVVAAVAIASGGCMVVLSILGLCGAGRNSRCLLALSAGFLVVLFLLQLCVIALTVLTQRRVESNLHEGLMNGIRDQYIGNLNFVNRFSSSYDNAQVTFECCGVDNYTDFGSSTKWIDRTSLKVPKTCCKLDKSRYIHDRVYVHSVDERCGHKPFSNNSHIDKPCFEDIKGWINETVYMLLVSSAVVAGVQVLGILVAICMIRNLGSSPKGYEA